MNKDLMIQKTLLFWGDAWESTGVVTVTSWAFLHLQWLILGSTDPSLKDLNK